jgi:hypothetical protein
VFLILGLAGSYPCFVNGFSSLDPYQLGILSSNFKHLSLHPPLVITDLKGAAVAMLVW